MADTFDLFRKLSRGANFDREKYRKDTALIQGKPLDRLNADKLPSALDFFGDNLDQENVVETVSSRHKGKKQLKRKRDKGKDPEEDTKAKRSKLQSDLEDDENNQSDVSNSDEEVNDEVVTLLPGHAPVDTTGGKRHKAKRKKLKQKAKKKMDNEKQALLRLQEANAFRNAHRIYVSGFDIPDPLENFQQLRDVHNVKPYLMENISSANYTEPTPIQMQAIPLMLNGREVFACAPTGSGKTLAFIVPILAHLKGPQRSGFRAVVLSPTRELAQQTYREFSRMSTKSGLRVHVLTKAKATANNFGPQSSQRFDILISTPNRLVHLLSCQPPAIDLHNVEWLVLDEADKLFEDGPSLQSFREQLAQVYKACDNPKIRHALFSATLTSHVEEFSHTYLDNPVRVIIGIQNSATETVQQELVFVGQESGKLLAMRNMVKKGFQPPVLVFVDCIERAKDLFHELIYDGINVDVMHSGRTQAQRDNLIKCFRTGKIWVLICTDLMARGIDFKGVNLVINYDCPSSTISYIHRIGRTGRAGRPGKAITFYTEDDIVNLRSIVNVMKASGCDVPDWMLDIKKPSKSVKKKLLKKPRTRDSVKTVSKYDLQRANKHREMVLASKKRRNKS